LLGGTGECETRDEAVVEHSPGPLAPAQSVERADHLRPCDAAQPDDRFALRWHEQRTVFGFA
jgi:DNA-binding helix-hairpin-helix protein with protein kinase domain